jgi:hypothetical protein
MRKPFASETSEKVYVVHFCKNKACGRAFLDIDRHNAKEPPRSRYCPLCNPKRKKRG